MIKSVQKSLLALGVCAAPAMASICTATDLSYEINTDCSQTTWTAIVITSYESASAYHNLGSIYGGAVCDTGGNNCDGSYRQPKVYKSSKFFNYWTYFDQATVYWNTQDQQLDYEYCQTPAGDPAATVENYYFTRSTGWTQIWCD